MKRTESSAPERIDKDTMAPQWMTPQYSSTTVGIVRNRADRVLVVSAMSGAVFQDNSFYAADRRHRRKRPYVHICRSVRRSTVYIRSLVFSSSPPSSSSSPSSPPPPPSSFSSSPSSSSSFYCFSRISFIDS